MPTDLSIMSNKSYFVPWHYHMQCTSLAILHLILLNPHEVGAMMIIPTLSPRNPTLGSLDNFLQITQLARCRLGFGILVPELTERPQVLKPHGLKE